MKHYLIVIKSIGSWNIASYSFRSSDLLSEAVNAGIDVQMQMALDRASKIIECFEHTNLINLISITWYTLQLFSCKNEIPIQC